MNNNKRYPKSKKIEACRCTFLYQPVTGILHDNRNSFPILGGSIRTDASVKHPIIHLFCTECGTLGDCVFFESCCCCGNNNICTSK